MDETETPKEISQKKEHKKIKIIHVFLFLLVLSVALNIFLILKMSNAGISGASFKLIEPTEKQPIDKDIQDQNTILHYNGLRNILEKEIQEYSAAENVALFVQDVKTGAWMGINERTGFAPASLLKIPVMMAILKKVDMGEIALNDEITLIQTDLDVDYGILYEKGVGTQVTVQELLKAMITYSDNTAKSALKRQLSMSELDTVFKHVGIPNPYLGGNGQTVSPRDYTRFFKTLYYSTFLSPALSERALELATDTQEENLISRGVPPEIQVSHKFGIFEDEMLHDCGIVYHQKNPYFICIMTKNIELTKSSELIRIISRETYEFVSSKS